MQQFIDLINNSDCMLRKRGTCHSGKEELRNEEYGPERIQKNVAPISSLSISDSWKVWSVKKSNQTTKGNNFKGEIVVILNKQDWNDLTWAKGSERPTTSPLLRRWWFSFSLFLFFINILHTPTSPFRFSNYRAKTAGLTNQHERRVGTGMRNRYARSNIIFNLL